MKKSRRIAYIATFIALIFIALLLDTAVGRVLIVISPAIFSLVAVFTLAFVFDKWYYSAIAGLAFGVMSCLRSLIGLGNPDFMWPHISIVPRIIVGFVCFGAYRVAQKLFAKNRHREMLSIGIGAAVGMLTNTSIVLPMLHFFGEMTVTKDVLKVSLLFNAPIELIVSAFITPILVLGIRRGLGIKIDSSNKKEELVAEEKQDGTCD